ncbi:hypothetical protein [Oleiharenicola sp. Vm1]|uniref:Ppx/GppA phosphatase family protein n=1 Tax=Oleiharenicola sp. Vm1 TaxID=3398393 RepID=UPI0039F44A9A
MSAPAVAVVDIGSNSIKALVAARAPDGGLEIRLHQSLDARISAGISAATPRLSEEGMTRGLAAVQALLALAAPFAPARTLLVATSAVRDAANGAEFRARIRAATGHEIRILTGREEANGIGRGLTADAALADLRDFYVFDLGGGSLECLEFRDRQIQQELSLQLGCVRLTEKFVRDPSAPFPRRAARRSLRTSPRRSAPRVSASARPATPWARAAPWPPSAPSSARAPAERRRKRSRASRLPNWPLCSTSWPRCRWRNASASKACPPRAPTCFPPR